LAIDSCRGRPNVKRRTRHRRWDIQGAPDERPRCFLDRATSASRLSPSPAASICLHPHLGHSGAVPEPAAAASVASSASVRGRSLMLPGPGCERFDNDRACTSVQTLWDEDERRRPQGEAGAPRPGARWAAMGPGSRRREPPRRCWCATVRPLGGRRASGCSRLPPIADARCLLDRATSASMFASIAPSLPMSAVGIAGKRPLR